MFGGALGLAGAYGLAMAGYWPGGSDGTELAELRSDLTTLYVKKSDIGGVVDRAVGEVQPGLSDLEKRIAALESQTPAETMPDLTPIDTRLSALESGLANLGTKLDAAVIGGGDADATAAVKGLGARMDELSPNWCALEIRPSVDPDTVSGLETVVVRAEIGGRNPVGQRFGAAIGARTRTGRSQTAARPVGADRGARNRGALCPRTGAGQGGPARSDHSRYGCRRRPVRARCVPSALEAAFLARVPDMLAARPADKSASWTDQALDRLKALVALRPVAGNSDATPEGAHQSYRGGAQGARLCRCRRCLRGAAGADAGRSRRAGGGDDPFRGRGGADLGARSEALVLAGAGS